MQNSVVRAEYGFVKDKALVHRGNGHICWKIEKEQCVLSRTHMYRTRPVDPPNTNQWCKLPSSWNWSCWLCTSMPEVVLQAPQCCCYPEHKEKHQHLVLLQLGRTMWSAVFNSLWGQEEHATYSSAQKYLPSASYALSLLCQRLQDTWAMSALECGTQHSAA